MLISGVFYRLDRRRPVFKGIWFSLLVSFSSLLLFFSLPLPYLFLIFLKLSPWYCLCFRLGKVWGWFLQVTSWWQDWFWNWDFCPINSFHNHDCIRRVLWLWKGLRIWGRRFPLKGRFLCWWRFWQTWVGHIFWRTGGQSFHWQRWVGFWWKPPMRCLLKFTVNFFPSYQCITFWVFLILTLILNRLSFLTLLHQLNRFIHRHFIILLRFFRLCFVKVLSSNCLHSLFTLCSFRFILDLPYFPSTSPYLLTHRGQSVCPCK